MGLENKGGDGSSLPRAVLGFAVDFGIREGSRSSLSGAVPLPADAPEFPEFLKFRWDVAAAPAP